MVKAKSKSNGETVAIKLIKGFAGTLVQSRALLRELIILRKLSCEKGKLFSTQIKDVILPEEVEEQLKDAFTPDSNNNTQDIGEEEKKQDK